MDIQAGLTVGAGLCGLFLAYYLPAFIPNVIIYILVIIFGILGAGFGIIRTGLFDTLFLAMCSWSLLILGYMYFYRGYSGVLSQTRNSLCEQYQIVHREQKAAVCHYFSKKA